MNSKSVSPTFGIYLIWGDFKLGNDFETVFFFFLTYMRYMGQKVRYESLERNNSTDNELGTRRCFEIEQNEFVPVQQCARGGNILLDI